MSEQDGHVQETPSRMDCKLLELRFRRPHQQLARYTGHPGSLFLSEDTEDSAARRNWLSTSFIHSPLLGLKRQDPNVRTEPTTETQELFCWGNWKGHSTKTPSRGLRETRRISTLWETFNSTQWITRGQNYRIITVTDCSKRKVIFTGCSSR